MVFMVQIIEKSWDVTPVRNERTEEAGKWKIEQCSGRPETAIRWSWINLKKTSGSHAPSLARIALYWNFGETLEFSFARSVKLWRNKVKHCSSKFYIKPVHQQNGGELVVFRLPNEIWKLTIMRFDLMQKITMTWILTLASQAVLTLWMLLALPQSTVAKWQI